MTVDWRDPALREEAFIRFYGFHLKHRAHPGCVYALMPWLRATLGWGDEEALWFAFLNGNTQHPMSSLILHDAAPVPAYADAAIDEWRRRYENLGWDTDRRYHKKAFDVAVESYRNVVGDNQAAFWRARAEEGWAAMWAAASSIQTFGRLSSWSYLEYLWITGFGVDADDLMLGDRAGSRSHRNGLCIVSGLDRLDWHPQSNPGFDGVYPPDTLGQLADTGERLLAATRARFADEPWVGDATRLTLESALCTYKSWHRPRRRYPGVYVDMMHDRVVESQRANPDANHDLWWQARADLWPEWLLLENRPGDPGVHEIKQDHYRLTGEIPMIGYEHRDMWSEFDRNVEVGAYGRWR